MKKISYSVLSSILLFFTPFIAIAAGEVQLTGEGWKAGVSRAVITPREAVWMAGYASRTQPSAGTLTDLWAKVLALEDSKGKKVILVTTDLLGFPFKMSNRIRNRISSSYGLTRSQIVLSSSHTHGGPVLQDALTDIYPLKEEHKEVIKRYSADLENTISVLVGDAIHSMEPARLYARNGVTRFQVNRRNNQENKVYLQEDLNGPNDYAVPVIKVETTSGLLKAIVFGYACHATTLSNDMFSGDYPGFAQLEIEKWYPGVNAMFFQGAGADQNPIPRRTIPLAEQYGRELAAAVDRVIKEEMTKLDPVLQTAYSEVKLEFEKIPDKEELILQKERLSGYQKQWAETQLHTLKKNGSLMNSYPYPLQIWKLGSQPIMVLGGEVVVEYAIELKKMFGPDIFVMGYANDDMAYIPTETILREGGYEGATSHMVYGLPSPWKTGIQKKILEELGKLALKTGIQIEIEQPLRHPQ